MALVFPSEQSFPLTDTEYSQLLDSGSPRSDLFQKASTLLLLEDPSS
ncbi:hypothetical protein LEMLEM_LOCUS14403 [Lemmus lemmus]